MGSDNWGQSKNRVQSSFYSDPNYSSYFYSDPNYFIGYLNTWLAVKGYEKKHGRNPLDLVHADLLQHWVDPDKARVARWPLIVKVWRKRHSQ